METNRADVIEAQLVDLRTVSLAELRSGTGSALAHAVRRVLAEADAPESLRSVGYSEGVINRPS